MDQPAEMTQFDDIGSAPLDPGSFGQVDPPEQPGRGRIAFAGALVLSCLIVGAVALVGLNAQPDSPPVLDDDAQQEEALEDDLLEDDLFDDDQLEDDAIVDDEVSEVDVVERLDGLAAPVAATLALASYEVTITQEVPSFSASLTSTVVGSTVSDRSALNGITSETLVVDGLVYELDGGVWYLKPVPQAVLGLGTLEDVIGAFADLPAREFDRADGVITVEVLCGEIDLASADATVRQACPQSGIVVATVDEGTGRLLSMRVDGTIEVFPGKFEEGFVEFLVESADDRKPFETPAEVDTSRAACIAEEMGLPPDDAPALMTALDGNDTNRNGEIYGPCGFALFPPGWDFLD